MESHTLDLRGVFGVLRRQARLIVLTFLIVMASALLATFLLQPQYTAASLVLVDPSQKNLLDPGATSGVNNSESARVDSEVALVKSRATLLSVVQSERLIDDPQMGPKLGWQAQLLAFLGIRPASLPSGEAALQIVIDNLDRATSAVRVGDTFLISVSATTGDPDLSSRIANALSNAYVRSQLDSKVSSVGASRDMLQARIAGSSSAIVESEQEFDSFLSQAVDSSGNAKLLELRRQIDRMTLDTSQLEAAAAAATRGIQANDWDAVARSLQLEALSNLERQRASLESQLGNAAENSDLATDLTARLSALEDDITSAADSGLADIRQRIGTSQDQITSLQKDLRAALIGSNLPADTLTRIYELQRNSEIARTQYDTLLGRLGDLENQTFLQLPDSRIAAVASPPSSPSFPNPRLILALAAFAAIALGVGLAFLYENFLGGFTSDEQASAVLHIPFITAVPQQRTKTSEKLRSIADFVRSAPLSSYSESIRRVRLSIELAAQRAISATPRASNQRGMVIMVTSAAPAEGKTTLALALSRVFSISGRRTLLIDSDLRNPRIHQHLGIESSTGLTDYLRSVDSAVQISSILTEDEPDGPAVAIGARISSSPTDQLVAGDTFGKLLNAATKTFDIVILDTPPVGPVVDALYLSRFADAVVFVVKWATSQQSSVRSAIAALEEAKRPEVEILGVLNQVQGEERSQRRYGSGYYRDA